MKQVAVLTAATVFVIAGGISAWADDVHHPDKTPVPTAQTGMPIAQEHMKSMQEQMEKIRQAKEPKEKEKLMNELMQAMQDHMNMMQSMMGGAMPSQMSPEQHMKMMGHDKDMKSMPAK